MIEMYPTTTEKEKRETRRIKVTTRHNYRTLFRRRDEEVEKDRKSMSMNRDLFGWRKSIMFPYWNLKPGESFH